ncbi:MAG: histidinol dehydrogenase, partial [Clostridia bacterium]|nr:histidinol dehydrogenase [Clostridia bacterium]
MIRTITYTSPDDLLFLKRGDAADVTALVRGVLEDVQKNGDAALYAYSRKFDKVDLDALEVTQAEIDEAFAAVDDAFLAVLREAKENITAFHKHQIENGFTVHDKDGVILGQRVLPLEKVGLYVPGGTAAYPSSVLMNCIPAVLAGCGEIVMVTPPSANGSVNPAILAAAKVAGV